MNDLQLWINTLGPTGAILALGIAFMRGLWPWVRDQYLARQVEALDKLVVLMTEFSGRQIAMEAQLAELRQGATAQREDVAAVFALLKAEQPSRPTRRPRDLSTKGAMQ
ncbi:MAG TPA: hypothetical protein PKK15_04710 [Kouleothrix sp.]|nr:hypothetical protein [Kouleothrix sp.]